VVADCDTTRRVVRILASRPVPGRAPRQVAEPLCEQYVTPDPLPPPPGRTEAGGELIPGRPDPLTSAAWPDE